MKRRDFLKAAGSAGVVGAAAGFGLARLTEPQPPAPSPSPTIDPAPSGATPRPPATPSRPLASPTGPIVGGDEVQALLDSLADTGGIVRISAGSHELVAPLRIVGSFTTVQGEGMGATVLHWRGPGAAIVNGDPARRLDGVTIRDLSIDNHNTADSSGILLEHFQHALVERCRLQGIGLRGVGVEFRGSPATFYNSVRGCWINCSGDGATGIRWTQNGGEPNANRVVDTILSGGPGRTLFDVAGGDTALILGCGAEGGRLLELAASYCQIIGTRFEGGPIRISGNFNQRIGNSYASSVEVVDSGQGNVTSGELDR